MPLISFFWAQSCVYFISSPQQLCEAGLRDPVYLRFSGGTGAGAEVSLTVYTATLQGELSGDKGAYLHSARDSGQVLVPLRTWAFPAC